MKKLGNTKEAKLVVRFFRLFDNWSIEADFNTLADEAQVASLHRPGRPIERKTPFKPAAARANKGESPLLIRTERFRDDETFTAALKKYVETSITLPHWLKRINLDALTRAHLANLVFVFISSNNTDGITSDQMASAAIIFLESKADLPPPSKSQTFKALRHIHHFCNLVIGAPSELGRSFNSNYVPPLSHGGPADVESGGLSLVQNNKSGSRGEERDGSVTEKEVLEAIAGLTESREKNPIRGRFIVPGL